MAGRFAFAAVVLLAVITGAGAVEQPLQKMVFLPQWSPQAQFAGYYTAHEKGFYARHGLDIVILLGGPDFSPTRYLTEKNADFITLWLASAIQLRSRGLELINIGQIVQRSALMLVARKSSGIRSYSDINGKKVSLWPGDFEIQPKAFFRRYRLDVRIIPQSYSVNLFLRGGVDVVSAMWYNEYHTILNSGVDPDELTTFFFDRYGLNFPEDGIYMLEETYRKDPERAAAFVSASIEGWNYAFRHPEEALDIVLRYMKRAGVPANRAHQRWMLARMQDIIGLPGSAPTMGMLREEDYRRVAEELENGGFIARMPPFSSFFTPCIRHVQE